MSATPGFHPSGDRSNRSGNHLYTASSKQEGYRTKSIPDRVAVKTIRAAHDRQVHVRGAGTEVSAAHVPAHQLTVWMKRKPEYSFAPPTPDERFKDARSAGIAKEKKRKERAAKLKGSATKLTEREAFYLEEARRTPYPNLQDLTRRSRHFFHAHPGSPATFAPTAHLPGPSSSVHLRHPSLPPSILPSLSSHRDDRATFTPNI